MKYANWTLQPRHSQFYCLLDSFTCSSTDTPNAGCPAPNHSLSIPPQSPPHHTPPSSLYSLPPLWLYCDSDEVPMTEMWGSSRLSPCPPHSTVSPNAVHSPSNSVFSVSSCFLFLGYRRYMTYEWQLPNWSPSVLSCPLLNHLCKARKYLSKLQGRPSDSSNEIL